MGCVMYEEFKQGRREPPHLNFCRTLVVMLVEVQFDITHHCCSPENATVNLTNVISGDYMYEEHI